MVEFEVKKSDIDDLGFVGTNGIISKRVKFDAEFSTERFVPPYRPPGSVYRVY